MKDNQTKVAFNWVKEEVETTLEQAQQAIQAFADDESDKTQLHFCANCMHQISGTMQILEFAGASLLAQEMEALAEAIGEGTVESNSAAYEEFLSAVLRLRSYLSRYSEGKADLPVLLLPTINSIRTCRKAEPLGAGDLINIDVEGVVAPPAPEPVELKGDIVAEVKALRMKFQQSLLGVIREVDTEKNIATMQSITQELWGLGERVPYNTLWWVSTVFLSKVESLLAEHKNSIKGLFGQMDRRIRELIEQDVNKEGEKKLLANMLFYVAQLDSHDEAVKDVQNRFKLNQLLETLGDFAQETEQLQGPGTESLRIALGAISQDLSEIKESLDLYIRTKSIDDEPLEEMLPMMRKIADTLAILGLNESREVVETKMKAVSDLVDGTETDREKGLVSIAETVLKLEDYIQRAMSMDSHQLARETKSSDINDSLQLVNARYQLVQESRGNLYKVKDAITDYLEESHNIKRLHKVPELLSDVEGALSFAQLDNLLEVVQKTNRFISKYLISEKVVLSDKEVETLADALSSVDYYLEGLMSSGLHGLPIVLEKAINSIAELEDHYGSLEAEKLPVLEDSVELPEIELVGVQEPEEDLIDDNYGSEASEEVAQVAEPEENADDDDLIDDEVREIFIEEAEEVLEEMHSLLPVWKNDQANEDALTTIRRNFHTLKGSGRMVGATDVGELSWSVENMLNRLIDNSISYSPELMETVEAVANALPAMVEDYAKGNTSEFPQELADRAERISKGEAVTTESTEVVAEETTQEIEEVEETVEETVEEPVEEQTPEQELFEVFKQEADDHIENLEAFSSQLEQGITQCHISDNLLRSLHTLKGVAHIADLKSLAKVIGPIESYFQELNARGLMAEQQDMALVAHTKELLQHIISTPEDEGVIQAHEQSLLEEVSVAKSRIAENDSGSDEGRDPELLKDVFNIAADVLADIDATNLQETPEEVRADAVANLFASVERLSTIMAEVEIDEIKSTVDSLAGALQRNMSAPKVDTSLGVLLSEAYLQLENQFDCLAANLSIPTAKDLIQALDTWTPEIVEEDGGFDLVDLQLENLDDEDSSESEQQVTEETSEDSSEDSLEIDELDDALFGDLELADIDTVDSSESDEVDAVDEAAEEDNTVDLETELDVFGLIDFSTDEKETEDTTADSADDEALEWDLDLSGIDTESSEAEETIEESLVQAADEAESDEPITDDTYVSDENLGQDEVEETARETEQVEESEAELVEESELIDTIESEKDLEETVDTIESETSVEELVASDEVETESVDDPADDEQEIVAEEADSEEASDESATVADEELEEPVSEPMAAKTADTVSLDIEMDDELLEIFTEEAEELFDNDMRLLEQWREAPSNLEPIAELQRNLHTLKGSARMAGFTPIGDLAHGLEDLYTAIIEKRIDASPQAIKLATKAEDKLISIFSARTNPDAIPSPQSMLREIEEFIEVEKSGGTAVVEDAVVEDKVASQETPDSAASKEEVIEETAPVKDDIWEQELVDLFLSEASELLANYQESVNNWSSNFSKVEPLEGAARNLHTLKGGAKLALIRPIADVAESLEKIVGLLQRDARAGQQRWVELLKTGHEALTEMVETVKDGKMPAVSAELERRLSNDKDAIVAQLYQLDKSDLAESDEQAKVNIVSLVERQKQKEEQAKDAASRDVIRVRSEILDNLVNLSGESSIYRSRLEQQVADLNFNLGEMSSTVDRLREQLRNLEIETEAQVLYRREISGEFDDFDPLEMDRYTRQQELTRSLLEAASDLMSIQETLDTKVGDAEATLLAQGRVNTELQDRLIRTRMVPFNSIESRLRRMVRQISSELNKDVDLILTSEGEMDRTVIERMVAPLDHMLRNAIDHGIEDKEERKRAGKPAKGQIRLNLSRRGNEVYIEIEDDGAGIRKDKVKQRAVAQGMIDESYQPSDRELYRLILQPGFSTADTVTQISGRGVGMDVVHSEILQLGGSLNVNSEDGKGTTMTVRLPFTLSSNQSLMVKVKGEPYAIPLSNITTVARVKASDLLDIYQSKKDTFEHLGEEYELRYLGQILERNSEITPPTSDFVPVLIIQGEGKPIAVHVDELLGSREIIVKNVGRQISAVPGISGASITGDGTVVLILDMQTLVDRFHEWDFSHEGGIVEEVKQEDRVPTVMVVDDSITVRKVTARLLQRHQFQVMTAKDGVDAITQLHDDIPDVMLLDIEMPRMDGFELATIIRHDERLKHIPIIMITSRTGEKHRERAEEIGVNQYLGKPYNEDKLLSTIDEMLELEI
ncbi:Hpt domain-containing protein [Kangiella spongicola]|uniref:Chemotaxis protein CheA n=1 Tax=Kangiella spongicola TaxID=796379 RepID=A0A318DEB7_9GAMM|nr:Hpt domain-containing protein [Kangiella spongicola]PXF64459.1 hybrid sensor histidine kinase/response regulator [Kangiella spongicola]